jgi:hypothetical protein
VDKDEANKIADALLAEARKTNARGGGRRVPFILRSKDSARLGRELEWELFRQVRRDLFQNRLTSVILVATPLVLFALFSLFMRHPASAWYVVAFDVAIAVPSILVPFHVRRELARRARLQQAGGQDA